MNPKEKRLVSGARALAVQLSFRPDVFTTLMKCTESIGLALKAESFSQRPKDIGLPWSTWAEAIDCEARELHGLVCSMSKVQLGVFYQTVVSLRRVGLRVMGVEVVPAINLPAIWAFRALTRARFEMIRLEWKSFAAFSRSVAALTASSME